MEENIKKILKEIMPVDETVIEGLNGQSDLTEIGLDSLKAIELVVYIEDEYNLAINDDDLFIDNMTTIDSIIQLIQRYQ